MIEPSTNTAASEPPSRAARLGEIFDRKANGFTAVRTFLAALVIVSHSFYLSGLGADPLGRITQQNLGTVAVDAFFALSGMLVTLSFVRSGSLKKFATKRLLRLMPGFWFCLIVTGWVIAPLVYVGHFGAAGFFADGVWLRCVEYVVKNAVLWIRTPGIDGIYAGLANTRVNPSLWTLFPEFICYCMLAVIGIVGLLRPRWHWLLAAGFALVLAALAVGQHLAATGTAATGESGQALLRLLAMGAHFFGGTVTVLLLTRLSMAPLSAVLLTIAYIACLLIEPLNFLQPAILAPMLAAIAAQFRVSKFWDATDVSYGLYLYGSAAQQALAWSGIATGNAALFFATSIAITVPLALLSWTFVERPALRFAHRR